MLKPLYGPVRLFARAGATADDVPHSIEAFRLGLRLGATGLQGDVWSTSDGRVVFDDRGQVGPRFRKRPIVETSSTDIGDSKVSLMQMYEELGSDFELMLNVRDPSAFAPLIEEAMDAGALDRLWIMSNDLELLGGWRSRLPEGRLVHSARMEDLPRGPEQHAAALRKHGVDAVSLRFDEWSAGHVTLFHRFTRLALAWEPQHERQMRELARMGIDAMVSGQVERMVEVTGT